MEALAAFSMWRFQEVLFRMSLKSEPRATVRDLDQGHVIANTAAPNWRGIWYPTGFETDTRAHPHIGIMSDDSRDMSRGRRRLNQVPEAM
jgi:hypothetical protein